MLIVSDFEHFVDFVFLGNYKGSKVIFLFINLEARKNMYLIASIKKS